MPLNRTTPEQQLEQAYSLRQQGYSIRDIAAELDIPKSTVDSGLRNYQPPVSVFDDAEPLAPMQASKRAVISSPATGESLGLVEARLSHERKMTELSFRQEEIKLQRKGLELRELEAANEREMLVIKKSQLDLAASAEEERVEGRKRQFVGKFNRLLNELLDNCGEDDTWSEEEVADYLERAEALGEKILQFCDYHHIDDESLIIVANLDTLIAYVEKAKDEKSGMFSSDVCFEADKEQKRKIESWVVSDFDEEAGEDEGDNEADEQEVDTDDEDD